MTLSLYPSYTPVNPQIRKQRQGRVHGGLVVKDRYDDELENKRNNSPEIKRIESQMEAWRIRGYSPSSTLLNNIQEVMKSINRLPGKLRSVAMGSIRGFKIDHKHVFNWLPGIQGHIEKLRNKSTERVDYIDYDEGTIPVRFVHYTIAKPKAKDGKFHIVMFGDPGYPNGTLDYNIHASRYLSKQNEEPIDAVLLTGDLLYASNEHDKQSSFLHDGDARLMGMNVLRPYHTFIRDKTPVFKCLGNNDIADGQGDALLNYMNLPHYYQVTFGDDSYGDALDLFVLDEASFSQRDAKDLDQKEKTTFYTHQSKRLIAEQQHWLKEAIDQSVREHPDRRRVILKHFPANGISASVKDKFYMAARLFTLGESYWKVDGILTGHEHQYANIDLTYKNDANRYNADSDTSSQDLFNSPLKKSVPQITLGSSSHVEPLSVKEAALKQDVGFVRTGDDNRLMPPMDPNMLALYTGFLWLTAESNDHSDDGEAHVVSHFVQPPMTLSGSFWGSRVMSGLHTSNDKDDGYHPNYFKVFDRTELKQRDPST
jgi:hypothetical protein